MNPTPKEKERKEYEMGLARAALGALNRKRRKDTADGGESFEDTSE